MNSSAASNSKRLPINQDGSSSPKRSKFIDEENRVERETGEKRDEVWRQQGSAVNEGAETEVKERKQELKRRMDNNIGDEPVKWGEISYEAGNFYLYIMYCS